MLWIVLGIILLLVFVIGGMYNGLVKARNGVKNASSNIDVQLKRRTDLIPNLVNTVKGYASHESKTLEAVISARNKVVSIADTGTVGEKVEADNQLTATLGRLMAVSEAYPDLKADINFLKLQETLENTENKISYARTNYNSKAKMFNDKIGMFPTNILANMFNFTEAEFIQIEEKDKEVPTVNFD